MSTSFPTTDANMQAVHSTATEQIHALKASTRAQPLPSSGDADCGSRCSTLIDGVSKSSGSCTLSGTCRFVKSSSGCVTSWSFEQRGFGQNPRRSSSAHRVAFASDRAASTIDKAFCFSMIFIFFVSSSSKLFASFVFIASIAAITALGSYLGKPFRT